MEQLTEEALTELERLSRKNHGILRVEDVVEAATAETSTLHSYFTWDDTEAARQYRMEEARRLIRVAVTIIDRPNKEPVKIRTYVSLAADREAGGGYRQTVSVLQDAERRGALLAEALNDLRRWQHRYAAIKELAPIFAAADKVARRAERKVLMPATAARATA